MTDRSIEPVSQPLLGDFVESAKLLLPYCVITSGNARLPKHTLPDGSMVELWMPEEAPQRDEDADYCLKHQTHETQYEKEIKIENYYSVIVEQRSDGVHYKDLSPIDYYEKGEDGKWHAVSSPWRIAMSKANMLETEGKTKEAEMLRTESVDLFRRYAEMQLLVGATPMERYLGAMSLLEKLRGAFGRA